MLEPQGRLRYLDQLRPPEGYVFDTAVGTTFSLDLLSLLIVPLSLVLFECEDKEEALSDPTVILEALRRTSGKIALFCQRGQIAVPKPHNVLFSYLEQMVVQVSPPNADGVFHPKVWLIRYRGEDGSVLYRFLCLSRNMTFDQSWDTILVMEGPLDQQRKVAFSVNRPLSDFIYQLPGLACQVSPSIREMTERMAQEVLRVRFSIPEPFEQVEFWPMGIPGYMKGPQFDRHSRLLIMSPFLSGDRLRPLLNQGQGNVLISRPESLDAEWETLKGAITVTLYVMEQAAERPQEEDGEEVPIITSTEEDPSGLHAKLYISEEGWNAHVFTGSANATESGLGGRNVEFLTELIGKRSKVGIDQVLVGDKGGSFGGLLKSYKVPEEAPKGDEIGKELDEMLRSARRLLSDSEMGLEVIKEKTDKYSLILRSKRKITIPAVKGSCWPAVLPSSYERNIVPLAEGRDIAFERLPVLALTSFLAFRLVAEREDRKRTVLFALNLPVKGMPESRNESILCHLISTTDKFVRYLLLLLSDNPEQLALSAHSRRAGQYMHNGKGAGTAPGVPLLEELVRAFSRKQSRLVHIEKLIRDLKKGANGESALPPGFEEIWEVFRQAGALRGDA